MTTRRAENGFPIAGRSSTQTERITLSPDGTLLRRLVENSPDIIYLLQTEPLRFAYVSPAVEAITGFTPREYCANGVEPISLVHPGDSGALAGSPAWLEHPERPVVTRWKRKAGGYVWIEDNRRPIFGEQGALVAIEGIARDITERRRAEEPLRLNEARLQAIYEMSQSDSRNSSQLLEFSLVKAIELTNSQFGYIYYGTAEGDTILRTRSLDSDASDLIKLRDRERMPLLWRMAEDSVEPVLINDVQSLPGECCKPDMGISMSRFLSVPIRSQEGVIAVIGVANRPTDYDDASARQLEMMMNSARTIIERNSAQAALAASEARHRALIESSSEHLFMLSPDGTCLASNDRVEYLGLSRGADLVGQTLEAALPASAAVQYADSIGTVLETGTASRFEQRLSRGGGEHSDHLVTLYPIMRDDRVWALGGICRDVTELHHAMTQLHQAQKMDAIGRMAGGVAHDFNNLLSVITGYAEIALESLGAYDPLRGDLEQILNAGQRSAELTSQLLALARRQVSAPVLVDLCASISKNRQILERLVGDDITVNVVASGEPCTVNIDPAQVTQILANLVIFGQNAISGKGSIDIELSPVQLDEAFCVDHVGCSPGPHVLLCVHDSGRGFDNETATHIFEPFLAPEDGGDDTGLGLAIVYGIVQQNHGYIGVRSRPEQGTSFSIYLPAVVHSADSMEAPVVRSTLVGTETILVVEDQEQILRLTARILREFGYDVIATSEPAEALATCENHPGLINLLLTDVVMPGMNGHELRARCASLRPDMRVLFMSGYTDDIIAEHGILDERVALLAKPFSPSTLATSVREVLDG